MDRDQIEARYQWDLSCIFADDEAWEKAFEGVSRMPDFSAYRGTLHSKENILAFLRAQEGYEVALMRTYLYAFLRNAQDQSVTKYISYLGKVMTLFTKFSSETSFALPELTALSDETLTALAKEPSLSDYDTMFLRLREEKKYVLSEKEERILALADEPLQLSQDVFSMLNDVELDLPEMEYDGRKSKITHGLYAVVMRGGDREKRAEMFRLYYGAYRKILSTLAVTYAGNVKKNIFLKTARGYESCLQMALFGEEVDRAVYDNLLSAVNGALPVLHDYMHARKQALGLAKMHMYDMHVSLVEDVDISMPYDEAFELVKKGLAPLGADYVALLEKGRTERWLDVYETPGKTSGAYSIGVYGNHPFVLLNYQETLTDIFTIAHEMGHAIHSYFSNGTQPYAKSQYKIFVAEVASTVNEMLLLRYLLAHTQDTKLKKYLLNYFMDMIRMTLFRQTQFAEFEAEAHAMAERGEPLNKDNLTELYYSLNQKYYGPEVSHDEEIGFEWARIPHFYNAFYVYKYATGITAAIAISDKILKEGAPAVEKYFTFLRGGCSEDPVSLLKGAGADLTKKETFDAALEQFREALGTFNTLA